MLITLLCFLEKNSDDFLPIDNTLMLDLEYSGFLNMSRVFLIILELNPPQRPLLEVIVIINMLYQN